MLSRSHDILFLHTASWLGIKVMSHRQLRKPEVIKMFNLTFLFWNASHSIGSIVLYVNKTTEMYGVLTSFMGTMKCGVTVLHYVLISVVLPDQHIQLLNYFKEF